MAQGALALNQCTIMHNRAEAGAGLFINGAGSASGSSASLNQCLVVGNSGRGGAIYTYSTSAVVDFSGCSFVNNQGDFARDVTIHGDPAKITVRSVCSGGTAFSPSAESTVNLDWKLVGDAAKRLPAFPADLFGGSCLTCPQQTYSCCGAVVCSKQRPRICSSKELRKSRSYIPCYIPSNKTSGNSKKAESRVQGVNLGNASFIYSRASRSEIEEEELGGRGWGKDWG